MSIGYMSRSPAENFSVSPLLTVLLASRAVYISMLPLVAASIRAQWVMVPQSAVAVGKVMSEVLELAPPRGCGQVTACLA